MAIHLPRLGAAAEARRAIAFAPVLLEVARLEKEAVYTKLATSADGLSQVEAARRLDQNGPNVVVTDENGGWPVRLLRAVRNPLVILLTILAAISFATGDARAGTVMVIMITLGVTLRFVQETRADAAAAKLKALIHVTATVVRGGSEMEIALRNLVPGDVIRLGAGDMIPADVRVVSSRDLFITQGTLTGESLPVEKYETPEARPEIATIEALNLAFLGTSVESGTATAVVVVTGAQTYFGNMAGSLSEPSVETDFDKGMRQFTWLMLRFIMVMVPLVFLINGFTKHNWHEAFFFSVAVAVGLTPEMLPMIVSVCLSKGALAMAKKKVVVKQLQAIQNFGAMDVLCTDKTGTLTRDQVILERHCDVMQKNSAEVLLHAYLIAHFQTGLRNVLDRAVLDHQEEIHAQLEALNYRKIDELPFDFSRRMMSVVVETPGGIPLLLTKGAPEAVFAKCTSFELDGATSPLEPGLVGNLVAQYEALSAEGFRVLAVAHKSLVAGQSISRDDESGLILKGYVAFLDPPKDSAARAIAALQAHGVTVKVLTGDNDLVTRKVCCEVGLNADAILLGSKVEAMSDAELKAVVTQTHIFARLTPAHKQRIIEALRANGHVVGYMGDGINDAPALHSADVGISVDSAVDIAKAAAAVILLEKDLMVLDAGVIEGRKVFVNILKYVRMGASSNFGNMFSVLGASAFLPFVPMLPIQVLTNNLLYDFSQVPIPTDTVGPDQTAAPLPWDIGGIKKFILYIGPISSLFDYSTFWVLLYVFGCWDPARASLFQTGWFVESLMTQTLIIHVIRTNKIPFIEGRASLPLTLTTLLIMGVAMWLPYSPLAPALGFVALPWSYWPIVFLTLVCYMGLTQLVKRRLMGH